MRRSWQEIVNLLAQITHVPTTLIMRIHPDRIEVNTSSETLGNPYRTGDAELLGNGLYCEQVIEQKGELVIPPMRLKMKNGKITQTSN